MTIDTIGGKEAELSGELSGDNHVVHGRVIKGGDVTTGKSGVTKRWTPDAIEEAAESLRGRSLVKNHVNDKVEAVVGKVTDVKYRPDRGLLFQANVSDNSIAKQVKDDLLDVSARIKHKDTEDLEEDDDGNKVVDKIREFVNLSFVPDGASKSNEVNTGPATNLSSAELAAAFDDGSTEGGGETSDGLRDYNLSSGDGIEVLTGNDLGEFVEDCTAENKTEKLTAYEV